MAIGPDQVNSKGASSLALSKLLLMFLVTLFTISIISSDLDDGLGSSSAADCFFGRPLRLLGVTLPELSCVGVGSLTGSLGDINEPNKSPDPGVSAPKKGVEGTLILGVAILGFLGVAKGVSGNLGVDGISNFPPSYDGVGGISDGDDGLIDSTAAPTASVGVGVSLPVEQSITNTQ